MEAIVGEKVVDGGKYYLVKWLGYSNNDNTWEPYKHVADIEALLNWENGHCEALVVEIGSADPVTCEEAVTCPEFEIGLADPEISLAAEASKEDSL